MVESILEYAIQSINTEMDLMLGLDRDKNVIERFLLNLSALLLNSEAHQFIGTHVIRMTLNFITQKCQIKLISK